MATFTNHTLVIINDDFKGIRYALVGGGAFGVIREIILRRSKFLPQKLQP